MKSPFDVEAMALVSQWQDVCGVNPAKVLSDIEKFGAENVIHRMIERNEVSLAFDALSAKKRLDLSLEALVVKTKWGDLFSDDEVNFCYSVLLQEGYTSFI